MRIALLTYDAPHFKTERFLVEMIANGTPPAIVIAAPLRKLNLPRSAIHTAHYTRNTDELCEQVDIVHVVCPHDQIPARGLDLAVVGGARILPQQTIDLFPLGVINMHPGLIPQNRGLSNVARAIRDGLPQAVTAHLVDRRVDAGSIIDVEELPMHEKHTAAELSNLLLDLQVANLCYVLALVESGHAVYEVMPQRLGGYEPPMTYEEEKSIVDEWDARVCAMRAAS